jgi:hypothetical protein
MRLLVFWVVVVYMIGCGTARPSNANRTGKTAVHTSLQLERKGGTNRIVFLTLGLWVQDSIKDEYGFLQKGVQYADGVIKKSVLLEGAYEPYQLYWEVKDTRNEIQLSGKVPDPLYQLFETSDPHSGAMEKHLVYSMSGEIMIRFNLGDRSELLCIYKLSNGKLKKLYEAKLL